ncbi:hypothetical protein EYZ11_004184 [Aspergillus tanneri]|uniref:Nuclear RNA binding protein n=1 Tax=Aspergillus tanneri TaxID=1220188 RepID=A0A4S3JLK5_9EURO|nr:hypothetical protein EYZ11_004184 [Aspergillus tanneri]
MSSNVDEVDPSHQLQQSLAQTCSHDESPYSYSQKHSRSSSGVYYDEFDLSSEEESGQFDDAIEELASPQQPTKARSVSSHSTKRRRSNDWPLDHGEDTSRSHGGSPRTIGRRLGNRGRRSRFVEGTMNDSVSEKPPSIFMRDANSKSVNDGSGPSQKSSGIFRFGKAIASAFNPFGVLGNVSDIWKGSETQKPADDTLARAEKAYAELKKAGYKGTVKGSYMQSMQVGPNNLADTTWKSIQEKMDYKQVGRHSRQSSGEGIGSGVSLRSSFQELRKAKSSLGIPSMSLLTNRRSDDTGYPEVRRQMSRKELQRQAKLLKRVSDLEEKLERARQELQELMSEDEFLSQTCVAKPYHRKFIPGELPCLPSERLLHNNSTPPVPAAGTTLVRSPRRNVRQILETHEMGERHQTAEKSTTTQRPKPPDESQPQSLAVDSPSRKRKSPDPQSMRPSNSSHPNQDDMPNHGKEVDISQRGEEATPSRKPKLAKMDRRDSPGSVERKQPRDQEKQQETDGRSPGEERGRRSAQPLRSASKRSPSVKRRASSSRNRATPSLRMKRGHVNLRSEDANDNSIVHDSEDKENQQHDGLKGTCYLDDESLLNPDQIAPSPCSSRRKDPSKCSYSYSYIPPVPPIPKDLAATAAKVDRRLAMEMGRKRETHSLRQAQRTVQEKAESFRWPDDIF